MAIAPPWALLIVQIRCLASSRGAAPYAAKSLRYSNTHSHMQTHKTLRHKHSESFQMLTQSTKIAERGNSHMQCLTSTSHKAQWVRCAIWIASSQREVRTEMSAFSLPPDNAVCRDNRTSLPSPIWTAATFSQLQMAVWPLWRIRVAPVCPCCWSCLCPAGLSSPASTTLYTASRCAFSGTQHHNSQIHQHTNYWTTCRSANLNTSRMEEFIFSHHFSLSWFHVALYQTPSLYTTLSPAIFRV